MAESKVVVSNKIIDAFEPSLWGDFFVTYTSPPLQRSEEWMRERRDRLKREVSQMFKAGKAMSMADTVKLVDTLERLGIDNHFAKEIDEALYRLHDEEPDFGNSDDLLVVALWFRLLRQHGFWVSTDVFDKFKDDSGSFNITLSNDPRGLLSLYNAAHMAVPGEMVLDNAISFTRCHLEAAKGKLRSLLKEQVFRALEIPLPRVMWQVEAMHYISEYEKEDPNDTKLYGLLVLLDDTFDVRATFEEAKMLDEALQRWDESAVSILPEYMRMFYIKTLSIFNDIEDILELCDKYRMAYVKEELKLQSKNSIQQAKWLNEKCMPSFKEQIHMAVLTSGFQLMLLTTLMGAGQVVNNEAFKWALNMPDMSYAGAEVGRFINDIAAYKLGKCKNDFPGTVECYMKEYSGADEEAVEAAAEMVEQAWKRMNKTYIEMERTIQPAAQCLQNLARSFETFYLHGSKDGLTYGHDVKEQITLYFLKQVQV
ncbi:unnamed protein product [Urochloa humidicola]